MSQYAPGPYKRVLLVKPTGSTGLAFALNPIPLGIETIAAYIRDEVEDVMIYDQFMERPGTFFPLLKEFQPDLVGFSMSATEHNSGGEMMDLVRKAFPHVPIIAGGFHPTGGPEIVLNHLDCDVVVRGEGEAAFKDFVKGLPFQEIEGLSYWDAGHSTIIHNPDRDPISDMDTLRLPAREMRHRRGYVYKNNLLIDRAYDQMEFGRGCYGLCTFCCEPYFSKGKMRYKSPERAMEEIRAIWEFHGRKPLRILIGDPHILGRPAAVEKLCDLLIAADLDITFQVMSRTEMIVKHRDVVEKMIRAGMISWEIGVESPKQDDLDITKKHIDLSVQNEGIRILRELGGEALGTFVVGLPHHMPAFVKQFPDYAKRIGLAAAAFGVATPFPGTGFWEELEKQDLIFETDWAKYDENHMVFRHPTMTIEQVENLRNWCLARFWNLDAIINQFRLDQIRVGKFALRHKIPIHEFLLTVARKLKFAVDAGSELAESSGCQDTDFSSGQPMVNGVVLADGGVAVQSPSASSGLLDATAKAKKPAVKVVRVSPEEKARKWVEYAATMFDAWANPQIEEYFREFPMHQVLDMRQFGRYFAGKTIQVVVEDRARKKCLLALQVHVTRDGIDTVRTSKTPVTPHDFLLRADLPRMYVDPTLPPLTQLRRVIFVFRTGIARIEGLRVLAKMVLYGIKEALVFRLLHGKLA